MSLVTSLFRDLIDSVSGKCIAVLLIWYLGWTVALLAFAFAKARPSWRIYCLLWVCPIVFGLAGTVGGYREYKGDLARAWDERGLMRWTPVVVVATPLVTACLAVPSTLWLAGYARSCHRRANPCGCAQCAYDLTGNISGICPECGTPTGNGTTADAKEEGDSPS